MAQNNQIQMPSGQGGLTRFSNEKVSKFRMSPGVVFILCLLIMTIIILLHFFGNRILGQ